jgi:type IV pilus assembly protein PilC
MPRFVYEAITETGSNISGAIDADTLEMATSLLTTRGYIPSRIRPEAEVAGRISWTGIKERWFPTKAPDLIIFTKQFRTMVRAGVPMLSLLKVLQSQTENQRLRNTIGAITADVQEGLSLYEAFRKHPKEFSTLYCSMIRAGESSGALAEVLERLIFIIDHEHKLRSDIKGALRYPILVTVFLGIAFFVLLTFAVPKFVRIFLSAGLELPLPTRLCMILYQALTDYWLVIGVALVAGIIALIYYFRTEPGRYFRDAVTLRLPIFGPLLIKAAMSRFASIFAILQASGVHVLDAIKILSGTIGNAAIAREFDRIRDQVEEGKGIAVPLGSAQYFTPMVINMVAIGEESGKLVEMLGDVASHYDDEVDYAMKRLSSAIGPMLTVGLAVVVGFFALAIFLPMWDLTKMVK